MTAADVDSFDRWRREINEDIEREEEAREAEAERRERVQRETTNGWDAYFRGLIAEERRFTTELLNEAFPAILGDLWKDIEKEVKSAIRLAFLERAGWTPRVRGTWVETEKYQALDLVAKDGTIWLAKHSDPGPCPGEGWQIVSARGERGKPGPIGPRGETGPPGPQGELGATITGWDVDRRRFRVTPILGGGRFGPSLDLRQLFEEFLDQRNGVAAARAAKVAEHRHVHSQPPLVQLIHGRRRHPPTRHRPNETTPADQSRNTDHRLAAPVAAPRQGGTPDGAP